jgi:hypothetical protein
MTMKNLPKGGWGLHPPGGQEFNLLKHLKRYIKLEEIVIYVIYFRCRLQTVYNLNYMPTTLGHTKLKGNSTWENATKKRWNTTGLDNVGSLMSNNHIGLHCLFYFYCSLLYKDVTSLLKLVFQ